MKPHKLLTLATAASTIALIAACGGGGGGSSSVTSAKSSSIGKVDGFGSVYVNGVEYETGPSTSYYVDDKDESASGDDSLAVGMKVKVVGRINDDGITGTADSIYYDDDLEGPIDSGSLIVNGGTANFTILGMAVSADARDTVFDDGASFAGLAEGQELEVSGFFDGSQIIASRIELQNDSNHDYEVKGSITQYDGATITLELQNGDPAGPYAISSSASIDLPANPIGTFAEVKLVDTGSGLEARRIESDDDDLIDDSDSEVKVRGILMGNATDGYTVNGIGLMLSNPLPSNITEGTEVEVEGTMNGDLLVVSEINSEDGDIEIKARVLAVTNSDAKNGTLTLDLGNSQTLDFTTDNSTRFEDSSHFDSNGDGSFTLDELTSSDFVEVEIASDGSGYYAYSIEREDDNYTKVEATVEAIDATSITLVGVSFTIDGSTTVTGPAPTVGDKVKVTDDNNDGTADQIEVES